MQLTKYLLTLAVSSLVAQLVDAADKLLCGPAPDWVAQHPVEAPPDDSQSTPVRTLLFDQQVRFALGERTIYTHAALKIQTPQGLAAGNLSFPWNPGTNDLTIHKLVIRRGDEAIDVLAGDQPFTTLRRE